MAILVAHRGGALLAPENTLVAFRKGIDLGADILECDVHLSRDVVPVCIHDAHLERTTDGNGLVVEHTAAELRAINAAAKYRHANAETWGAQPIPTLEELLALAANTHVQLYIEIKLQQDHTRYPQIEERVIELVHSYDMSARSTIICFDFDTIRRCRSIDPSIKTSALIQRNSIGRLQDDGSLQMAQIINEIRYSGAESTGVSRAYLTPELVAAAHEAGLSVGVWTVNDLEEIQRFLAMQVDSLTSDRPDFFAQVRA